MKNYMDKVKYEETFENQGEHLRELYFTAPKELLKEVLTTEYPEADSATLLLKIPDNGSKEDIMLLISPTKEEDGCSEDYDWTHVDDMFEEEDVEYLISLAGDVKNPYVYPLFEAYLNAEEIMPMGKFLTKYPEVSVHVKRALIKWAGETEDYEVSSDGSINNTAADYELFGLDMTAKSHFLVFIHNAYVRTPAEAFINQLLPLEGTPMEVIYGDGYEDGWEQAAGHILVMNLKDTYKGMVYQKIRKVYPNADLGVFFLMEL